MADVNLKDVIQILNLVADAEPIALKLVQELLTSLKGKTTEEIIAMNETIFDKVIAKAAAEGA